jgi:hypothetical protein
MSEKYENRSTKSKVFYKWQGALLKEKTPFSLSFPLKDFTKLDLGTEIGNDDGYSYVITEIEKVRVIKDEIIISGTSHRIKGTPSTTKKKY